VVPLGWDKFSTLVEGATVPVYALGGMHPKHMMAAWEHGAQGLAVLSSVWLADAPEDVIRQYIARS
ncbi:MAG: hypothetical protein GTO02_10010, partial [Candidatus Dadabacteria bacterium]|nr:hypothetical protein [Candidatus Dadabacteria bacterium]